MAPILSKWPRAGRHPVVLALGFLGLTLFACGSANPIQEATAETSEAQAQVTVETQSNRLSIFGLEENRLETEIVESHLATLSPQWVRRNGLLWSAIEPEKGQRNWDRVAAFEEDLARKSVAGVETIVIIRSSPSWAQAIPGSFCGPIKTEAFDSFSRFIEDAVRRYSAPPYNVRYWELWNEPDVAPETVGRQSVFGCWGDPADSFFGGGYYAEMLKIAYPAIKSANPDAFVLHGGLLLDCDPLRPPPDPAVPGNTRDCASSLFLQGVLENGGGCCFDGVSFHAYDYYSGAPGLYGNLNWNSTSDTTGPVIVRKAQYLRAVLDGYNLPDKSLFNTEGALLCGSTGEEPECLSPEFERTKTQYLVQSYASALRQGLVANIWFSLQGWRASGLLDASQNPNEAYRAYEFAARTLSGARFVDEITMFPGVGGAGFQIDRQDIWILWSLDGLTHTIEPSLEPSRIVDAHGVDRPLSGALEITYMPVFLFWENK